MSEFAQGKAAEQEIAELEELLREKREAFRAEEKSVPEREAFKETFRETYGEHFQPKVIMPQPASGALPHVPPQAQDELNQQAQVLKAQEREGQLETLIALAFSKGIRAAADVARHATPWLMDELHDRLQDRYYDQLIQSRQLRAI